MPRSIRETCSFLSAALCVTALAGACADSQEAVLDSSASSARAEDARTAQGGGSSFAHDPGNDLESPEEALDADAEQSDDSGSRAEEEGRDAEVAENDAAEQTLDGDTPELDAGAPELDADAPALDGDAPEGDASGTDAAVTGSVDAGPQDVDAGPDAGDAGQDAGAVPDAAACTTAGQSPDACGVCGGDGSSCRHPLTGHYAARTQFYARQQATLDGTTLDLVSKGSLLSVVDISASGVAKEHYCFLEIVSPDGLFVWSTPSTVQQIADTSVPLEQRAGRFVRPLAAHRAYFGWSPQAAPTDCVTGQIHATGCLCGAPDALPTAANDCRVRDIDGDGAPGGSMYLDLAQPADPSAVSTQLKLNIVALLNLQWSLAPLAAGRIVGQIDGGLQQAVLSLEGALAGNIADVDNVMCNSALGHVELVSGNFDCSSILAGRTADAVTYGIFDAGLDAPLPSLDVCEASPGS